MPRLQARPPRSRRVLGLLPARAWLHGAGALAVGLAMVGCDRGGGESSADKAAAPAADNTKDEPAKGEPAKAELAKAEPTKIEPAKAEPAKVVPVTPEPARPEPVVPPASPVAAAEPAAPPTNALVDLRAELCTGTLDPAGADATKAAEHSKLAWGHYKGKRYAEAACEFAHDAVFDPSAWKPPFNLACALAKAGQADDARIALTEAVRRGGSAAASSAKSDGDLASLRSETWFTDLLATAPPRATDEGEDDDEPDGDDEEVPLPFRLHVALPASTSGSASSGSWHHSWTTELGADDSSGGPGLASGEKISPSTSNMAGQAKNALKAHTGGKVTVSAVGAIRRDDGGIIVYALAQGDRQTMCAAREGGDEAAKTRCAAMPSEGKHPCPEIALARVVLGAPGKSNLDRTLEVTAMAALPGKCKLASSDGEIHASTVELRDVDGDGKPEVLTHWYSTYDEEADARGQVMLHELEWLAVHRLDLGAQAVVQAGDQSFFEGNDDGTAIRRVRLVDVDGDSLRDLVLDERDQNTGTGHTAIRRTVYAYAKGRDRWPTPETRFVIE